MGEIYITDGIDFGKPKPNTDIHLIIIPYGTT